MAVTKIKVNTGSLSHTSSEFSAHLQKIRDDMNQLNDEMNALNASWTGPSRDAFKSQIDSDLQRLEELCKAVDKIINYENTAVKEYDACESKVASIISSLKV